MTEKPDIATTGEALLRTLGVTGGKPVSAWPDTLDWLEDDECDDWVVGLAKHHCDGSYYAVTAEDIEVGDTPGVYEQIAMVRGRVRAQALAAHLNALNGAAR